MLIVYRIEKGVAFFYNISTHTWERDPRKGTLIKDVDIAYKLRNALNNMGFGDGSVKWIKEKYTYGLWALGSDLEDYIEEFISYKQLNEKEKDKAVSKFCSKIMEQKNISLALWGINFVRKEYLYEEL